MATMEGCGGLQGYQWLTTITSSVSDGFIIVAVVYRIAGAMAAGRKDGWIYRFFPAPARASRAAL